MLRCTMKLASDCDDYPSYGRGCVHYAIHTVAIISQEPLLAVALGLIYFTLSASVKEANAHIHITSALLFRVGIVTA